LPGITYSLVNQVEALYGFKMLNGEEVPDIAAARNSVQLDEFGKVVNTARRDNVVEAFAFAADSAPKRQKTDKSSVASDEDFRETEHVRVIRLLAADSQAQLKEHGMDGGKPEVEARKIQELLIRAGFPDKAEMLYVTGHKSAKAPVSISLDALQGVYYHRPDEFNGRPCYQKVFLTSTDITPLGCTGHFISWSRTRQLWKIGQLGEEKAGIAICRQDKPNPAELDQAWCLYEPPAKKATGEGGDGGEGEGGKGEAAQSGQEAGNQKGQEGDAEKGSSTEQGAPAKESGEP